MMLIMVMLINSRAVYGSEVKLDDPVQEPRHWNRVLCFWKIHFCLGLFSAAFSSFLVNSMIGGFIVSDCLGFGSDPKGSAPRVMTTVALLTGMSVAVACLLIGFDRTPTIIAAQAVTVVGAPLVAGVLLWLSSSRDVMGSHAAGTQTKIFAGIGLVVLLAIAANLAINKLPASINRYLDDSAAETTPESTGEPPVQPTND